MPLTLRSNDETQSPPVAASPALALEPLQAAATWEVAAQRTKREETLDTLLVLYAKEEERRMKYLSRCNALAKIAITGQIMTCGVMLCAKYFPAIFASLHLLQTVRNDSVSVLVAFSGLLLFLMTRISGYSFSDLFLSVDTRDEWRRTPLCSSRVQQDTITALLNYADSPRVAEALCHALTYYTGDKNLLYLRLARVLPLLPNDREALTPLARRILRNCSRSGFYSSEGKKEQHLPVLLAAIPPYLARIGEPLAPSKRRKNRRATFPLPSESETHP